MSHETRTVWFCVCFLLILFFWSHLLAWNVAAASKHCWGCKSPFRDFLFHLLPKPGSSGMGWAARGLVHLVLQHNYMRRCSRVLDGKAYRCLKVNHHDPLRQGTSSKYTLWCTALCKGICLCLWQWEESEKNPLSWTFFSLGLWIWHLGTWFRGIAGLKAGLGDLRGHFLNLNFSILCDLHRRQAMSIPFHLA